MKKIIGVDETGGVVKSIIDSVLSFLGKTACMKIHHHFIILLNCRVLFRQEFTKSGTVFFVAGQVL